MFRSYETKKEFLELFGRLSAKVRHGSGAFLNYLEDYNNSEPVSPNFKNPGHDADSIAHKINEKLYKSYLTPFEPADIQMLAEKVNGLLDLIVSSHTKLGIFKLKRPFEDIIQLALILDQSVLKLEKMIESVGDPKCLEAVLQLCAEIRALESQADNLMYILIKDLFDRENDPIELFSRKQILEQIGEATNRCKEASDIIEGIILKNG